MYEPSETRYETMPYNRCGKSGLRLPALSVGLWQNFGVNNDYDTMKEIILTAFDHGVTHFDLANNYGPEPGRAEINFGRIFKENLRPYRDQLIISTKAGYEMWPGPYGGRGGSRKYLTASLDQSLQRMGLEYVDIFYHHCMTPDTPLKETALCLADLVRRGKTLYVGMSNYDGKTMHRMYHKCDDVQAPFVINQNRYSIFDRTVEKNKLLKEARDKGKGVICFSPLAQGQLSDNTPKASRRAPVCLATKSCKPMWVMISTVPSRSKNSISWQKTGARPFLSWQSSGYGSKRGSPPCWWACTPRHNCWRIWLRWNSLPLARRN